LFVLVNFLAADRPKPRPNSSTSAESRKPEH